jgi:hypothetical protein
MTYRQALLLFCIVTGVLSALALVPGFIVLGPLIIVVPGLVLMLAPYLFIIGIFLLICDFLFSRLQRP